MGGLLAGNMLIREGWTVEVLERTREGLEARGAGIVPQRSLMAALKRAGVTVRPDIGIRVIKRAAYDRTGKAFATHQYDQYSTSWSLLYNLLREAFPAQHFHAGRNVSKIVQDKHGAAAILDDGTRFEGDLLIGADGMRSTVRQALFHVQPRYAGYLAWRGMLALNVQPFGKHRNDRKRSRVAQVRASKFGYVRLEVNPSPLTGTALDAITQLEAVANAYGAANRANDWDLNTKVNALRPVVVQLRQNLHDETAERKKLEGEVSVVELQLLSAKQVHLRATDNL